MGSDWQQQWSDDIQQWLSKHSGVTMATRTLSGFTTALVHLQQQPFSLFFNICPITRFVC